MSQYLSETYLPAWPVVLAALFVLLALAASVYTAAIFYVKSFQLMDVVHQFETERNLANERYLKAERELILLQRSVLKLVKEGREEYFREPFRMQLNEMEKRLPNRAGCLGAENRIQL